MEVKLRMILKTKRPGLLTVQAKGHTLVMLGSMKKPPHQYKQQVKLVLKHLEVCFPHDHTFSPGVTDILQMQCI